MKLAIIGAGNVGGSLGRRFRSIGHEVKWGVPNPTDPKYAGLDTVDVGAAARDAEVVILAVPWSAAEKAIASLGGLLGGKILVDVINPIAADFSGLVDLPGTSGAEEVARWAPKAKVVKAFNTVGNNIMDDPAFGPDREGTSMLVAGDDAGAKSVVMNLASEIGFDPLDAGPLSISRYLEAFAWVWITLAVKQGLGRDIAFHLMRRGSSDK
jgi:predicted dinucleotide-binding enzyme